MKSISKYFLGASLALALSLEAQAVLSITPATPVIPGWTTPSSSSNAEVMAQINELLDDPILAYKANADATVTEEGPFASSYSTSFFNTPTDPSDATISYISGPALAAGVPTYLLVKDGNNQPIAYLFDITGWDGTESISLTGFWPNRGAISYVGILTNVPDGGATVMLLGMALSGLVVARRFGRSTTR